VSLSVLVVGNGKPYHVSVTEADRLEHDGIAVWQKRGRRIKITKGKRSRPKVRGLSCYVGAQVTVALRGHDRRARDVAGAFVNDQFQRRESVATA
jgi:hypothetical protein